jgi:hypothetical protein
MLPPSRQMVNSTDFTGGLIEEASGAVLIPAHDDNKKMNIRDNRIAFLLILMVD